MSSPAPESSGPRAYLSRRYHLSASHRLHTDHYTPEENLAIYGKCNNPHGHGHNYVVEVTMGGAVDPVTGMVCDLGRLDSYAREHLISRFHLKNLNTLPEFQSSVSTTENFTREIYRIFAAFPLAQLTGVRVEETSNNSFEYDGTDLHRKAHDQ